MSKILLYPSGAFVSFTCIVSFVVTSSIFTVPKSKIPFSPVTFLVGSFPGNVTSNSAPANFIDGSSLSTFSNCI